MTGDEGRSSDIRLEQSFGNFTGIKFDDSRHTARLERLHPSEKLWHPTAAAVSLMGDSLSTDEATALGISRSGQGISRCRAKVSVAHRCEVSVSDDGFANYAPPAPP